MRHNGIALADAQTNTRVSVELSGISACKRCEKGVGCGVGVFSYGSRAVQLDCLATVKVHRGERVEVELDTGDSSWLWLVAGAFGLPTVGVLAGGLLGQAWVSAQDSLPLSVPADIVTAMVALLGLAGGVIAWRWIDHDLSLRVKKGLCLQSARIVAVDASSVKPAWKLSDET